MPQVGNFHQLLVVASFEWLRFKQEASQPLLMALQSITFSTFRNHRASRLEGTAALNLLFGENGAGKTNVLEAISLLAPGRGLRRAALLSADDMAEKRTGHRRQAR